MNARELKARVLPSLLGGTRRHPIALGGIAVDGSALRADDPKAALKALSLMGQAIRFERPAAPEHFAVEAWPRDERRMVPEALRWAILRLLEGGKCAEETALALAWAMERAKVRPHPFDLPKMDGFVRTHAQRLGVTAQYWSQREAPAERRQGYFDADEIDETTWTEAPLGRRAKFLQEMRGRDAAAARAMLELAWPGETADARMRLLAAMQTGLSVADRGFLEGLKKDRAPRVKGLAQRLLGKLPGGDGSNPALTALMERIQSQTAGLLRKRRVLKLELPATVKEHEAKRWVMEMFADVGIEELARATEVADVELVKAAEKDEHLLLGLAMMATRERRLDLLEAIVTGHLPDAWGRMAECGFEEPGFLPVEERVKWVEMVVSPFLWMPEAGYFAWSWLLKRMEGPLPERVMEQALGLRPWLTLLEGEKKASAEHVQVFCALCPAGLRAKLRDQVEPLEAERKDKGILLMEILENLERVP